MGERKERKREERDRKRFAQAVQNEIDRRAAMRREGIRLAAEAAGWPLSTAALMIEHGVTARGALLSFLEASEHVQ